MTASLQAILALGLLIHTNQNMNGPKAKKRLFVIGILLVLSIIFSILGTNKMDIQDDFYANLMFTQNVPGRIILAGLVMQTLQTGTPLLETKLLPVLIANEGIMIFAAIMQSADVGNQIANEFLFACLTGLAATLIYSRFKTPYCPAVNIDPGLKVCVVGAPALVSVVLTCHVASQVADQFEGFRLDGYDALVAYNVLLYMPYFFTRIHLPFNLGNEPQSSQSSQPGVSMQEPVVATSAEPVSNTYGVNIVEVNGREKNIPTAVAVPVTG